MCHYYTIITSLLHIIMTLLLHYYVLLHHYYVIIMYYYRNNESIISYYYRNNESIITVIMNPLLRIITRSIIRNHEFIITYYRPGQLGDADLRPCTDPGPPSAEPPDRAPRRSGRSGERSARLRSGRGRGALRGGALDRGTGGQAAADSWTPGRLGQPGRPSRGLQPP